MVDYYNDLLYNIDILSNLILNQDNEAVQRLGAD